MSVNEFDKRMKQYEKVYTQKLIPHIPIIIRIDGHNFHKYTKVHKCEKPFAKNLSDAFTKATRALYNDLGNFDLAYGQSDEVSILIYNPDTITQERYDGKTFKYCSLIASLFTGYFNVIFESGIAISPASFDCRVFQLPVDEVPNYFIWRQKDAVRNSIQMVGQANFSHKQLQGKSCSNIQDMLMEKGINWNDIKTIFKRGWCVFDGCIDEDIPIFTQDRAWLECFIKEAV